MPRRYTDEEVAERAHRRLAALHEVMPSMPVRRVIRACRDSGVPIGDRRVAGVVAAFLARPKGGSAAPEGGSGRVQVDGDGSHRLAVSAKGQGLVRSLDDLVREGQIDVDRWTCERHRVNTWTSSQRGPDDEPVIVRHWQVRADFAPRIRVEDVAPLVVREWATPEVGPARSVLVVPDSQHGYRWAGDRRDRLDAMHDEQACAVVPVVAAAMQPDVVVLLGDHLDLAEWSTRWPRPEELRGTSQVTLQAVHDWIAAIRAAAPGARIVYIEGNHEERVRRGMVEQGSPAQSIRAVGEDVEALSVARLLALGSLGVEYVGPYGTDFWLGRVRFAHGEKVRQKGGATAAAVLTDATTSTWYGHIHRLELAQRTIHDHTGARVITAASPGCLCRIDGAVPGVSARPDWQQGLGFLWVGDDGTEWPEVRRIHAGRIRWGDRFLTA